MDRRKFISTALLAPFAGSFLQTCGKINMNSNYKFAIATYSYWHFREPKITVQQVIDHASNLGVDGVDVLHVQMDNESPEYIRSLRDRAQDKNIEMICLSIHQDFVDPDKEKREKNIDAAIFTSLVEDKWIKTTDAALNTLLQTDADILLANPDRITPLKPYYFTVTLISDSLINLCNILGKDKNLVGKEKTEYFKQLNKVLKNPADYPDAIKDLQKQLGIEVGLGFRSGGLAKILEV